jgi:hypothetical protein
MRDGRQAEVHLASEDQMRVVIEEVRRAALSISAQCSMSGTSAMMAVAQCAGACLATSERGAAVAFLRAVGAELEAAGSGDRVAQERARVAVEESARVLFGREEFAVRPAAGRA